MRTGIARHPGTGTAKRNYWCYMNRSLAWSAWFRVAQWKRGGPITLRSLDRNQALKLNFDPELFYNKSLLTACPASYFLCYCSCCLPFLQLALLPQDQCVYDCIRPLLFSWHSCCWPWFFRKLAKIKFRVAAMNRSFCWICGHWCCTNFYRGILMMIESGLASL